MKETIIEVRAINEKRGIPLWTALLALLVLAGISVTVLVVLMRRATDDRARMEKRLAGWEQEKQKAEIDRQKAAEQAKAAVARTRQSDALAQVRTAKDACEQLLKNVRALDQEASSLRTSAAGTLVAQFPDLVGQARRLYDSDLKEVVGEPAAIAKVEDQRRLESQLVNASGTSFEPDSNLTGAVQADALWSAREGAKVDRARSLIANLISESKIKVPSSGSIPSSQTLEQAMAGVAMKEASTRQNLIVEKTAVATTVAKATTAAAESERIVNEAKLQAAQILETAKAKALKQQQDLDLQKAAQQVETAKVKVAVDQATDEARKVQLRAKLTDPKVLSQLSAFTTPGYLQTDGRNSYERRPLSYTN